VGSCSSGGLGSARQNRRNVRAVARSRVIHRTGDKPVHCSEDVCCSFGATPRSRSSAQGNEALRVTFPAACGAHCSRQRVGRLAHRRPAMGSPPNPRPKGRDPYCESWPQGDPNREDGSQREEPSLMMSGRKAFQLARGSVPLLLIRPDQLGVRQHVPPIACSSRALVTRPRSGRTVSSA
jgi:hypothetical protein